MKTGWRAVKLGCARTLTVLLCLGVSIVAFRGVLSLPLPERRWLVLGLAGGAGGISILAGWILGKLIITAAGRGGFRLLIFLPGLPAATFAISLALDSIAGHTPWENPWAEALSTGLALAAVVAFSRAIGGLVVSRRERVPARRRLVMILVLYTSVLVPFVLQRKHPWPWSAVTPAPQAPGNPKPVREIARERTRFFPVNVSVDARRVGDVRFRQLAAAYGDPFEKHPQIRFHDDVIRATGQEIALDDVLIRFVGFGVYASLLLPACHPDGRPVWRGTAGWGDAAAALSDSAGEGKMIAFWDANGALVPGEEIPPATSPGKAKGVCGSLVFDIEGELDLTPGGGELVMPPWEVSPGEVLGVRELESGPGRSRVAIDCDFLLPVSGPYELRLLVIRGTEAHHLLASRKESVLELDRNTIQYVGCYQGTHFPFNGLHAPMEMNLIPSGPEGFTSVFLCAVPEVHVSRLHIDAIGPGARLLKARNLVSSGLFVAAQFDQRSGEVPLYRVGERSHLTQVRVPIGCLPVFPVRNRGIENWLNLEVPYELAGERDVVEILDTARLRNPHHRGKARYGAIGPGSSLRSALDHCYRGGWQVDGGGVVFRPPRGIVTRIREAIRGPGE